MKPLKILMSCWEDLIEEAFRVALQDGGHTIKFLNTWKREQEFLEEAKVGQYDLIIVSSLGLPLNHALGLIAPLRQAVMTRVIVFAGMVDEEWQEIALRDGAFGFHQLPMPLEKIREAVEATGDLG